MKDEIAHASGEASQLRQEVIKKDKQIKNLKKANFELNRRLKLYRKQVADLHAEFNNISVKDT